MAVLRPAPVNIDRFTFVPDEYLLMAEDSDLPRMERVFDDACDEGYTLVTGTGTEVVYAVSDEERRDGELLYWDLRPALSFQIALPTIRVFND